MSAKTATETGPEARGTWLAVLIGLLLCAITLGLWRMLSLQEEINLDAKVKAQGDYLASLITADLRNRLPALERMTHFWEGGGRIEADEFRNEAQSYISDVPGFQALEWADRNAIVRWVIPIEGNEKALNLDLNFEKTRQEAMRKARISLSASMTPPVDLVQGGKGFLTVFPIHVNGEIAGYVLGVFRISEWLDYVFNMKTTKNLHGDFRIAVSFDDSEVYRQGGWEGSAGIGREAVSSADILDHALYIHVRPTAAFMQNNRSSFPLLTAIFGLLLSVLTGFVVRLYQGSYLAAQRATAAKAAMELEFNERRKAEMELKVISQRVAWALKAARMGLWTWDIATNRLSWNERMFELFDIPPDVEPVYETWRSSLLAEDLERVEPLLMNAAHGRAPFDTEFRIVLSDDSIRHVRAAARVERDTDGNPKTMTGLNWDISEVMEAEAALRQSEEQVRLLLNSTGEAIYGIDLDGNCTFANPACARMLDYPDTQMLLGRNMHKLIHHSWSDGLPMPVEDCRIYKAFTEGKHMHVDDEVLWRRDGKSLPVEYWSYPQVAHGEVIGAVVTFVDISERKKAEETIRHMATHDGLTDLPTRRLYRDRVSMAINSARRNRMQVAVMFLDLDGFKAVNDSFGHDAGDEVLKEVAIRLRLSVRDTDTVARMGGDEFALVITELQSKENASAIAEKAIQHVAQPFLTKGIKVHIGVSIGISIFPDDSDDVDRLINLADEAMYRVKKNGKNAAAFAGE